MREVGVPWWFRNLIFANSRNKTHFRGKLLSHMTGQVEREDPVEDPASGKAECKVSEANLEQSERLVLANLESSLLVQETPIAA